MKDYEKIGNCNDTYCKYFDENMELNCAYSEDDSKCIKTLKPLSSHAVLGDGWRDVRKELPEDWVDVLVSDGKEVSCGRYNGDRKNWREPSTIDIGQEGDGLEIVVRFWRPLPHPPAFS